MADNQKQNLLPLGKKNYIIIAASIVVLIIGFILLSGGGVKDPTTEFSYDIFSIRRLVIAPIVLLIGFVAVGVGIMKKFNN